jgi:NADPH2:quinone reductase
MKAIVVPRRGGPEVLEVRDIPEPSLRDANTEVLVEVEAAGVNFADTVQTQGAYPHGPRPPYVPGLEFAGRVRGSDERVMGFTASGAYAPLLLVKRSALIPLPEGWSFAQGAAFPVNYFTAYFGYWMAGLTQGNPAGKRILIHAVAGGVGTAAVEIGTLLGVETFGTSSSDEKLARAQELGLKHAINYRKQDYQQAIMQLTHGEGVDAVFEMLGGEHTARSTRCLRSLGRLVSYGMATGQSPQFDFAWMFQNNISVHALWLTPLTANGKLMERAWDQLSNWIGQGKLRPVVGTELSLEQAAEAHRMLLGRRNFAKVILKTR